MKILELSFFFKLLVKSDLSSFYLVVFLQYQGRIKLNDSQINFKNNRNNRSKIIESSEIEKIDWMRIGNKPGIRISMSSGIRHRFGGFAEKVVAFAIFQ